MMLSETARAKVNLTLEVLGRRPDGYHELRSLVAFADYGDTLRLEAPSAPFSLNIDGPFAAALEGRNLVQAAVEHYARVAIETSGEGTWPDATPLADKAADSAYRDAQPATASPSWAAAGDRASGGGAPSLVAENRDASPRGAFRLTKRIPVAAGLGGGSADAAAALRLLSRMTQEAQPLERLLPLAAQLGADVPVCLLSKPAMMTGIGERLTLLPGFPKLPALLVNPRLPLATAAVFRELRAAPLEGTSIEEVEPAGLQSLDAVLDYAKQRRNDLEAPACRLLPAVGAILACLERTPGVVLARLSGSGPTCFALFREWREAEAAARRLRSEHAGWWIEAVTL